jgi:hypothetical protein
MTASWRQKEDTGDESNSSAPEQQAIDAVAQLTALLQAKSQEAERLRTHIESLEQLAECCICLERNASHAFRLLTFMNLASY